MKYIVLEVKFKSITKEYPIIFPNDLVHADVAEAIRGIFLEQRMDSKPIAAGECYANGNCSGWSETLGMGSRGDIDSHLISSVDYGGGIK